MFQVSNRIKGAMAGAALTITALYFKHAVRFEGDEIPLSVRHDADNGFDYYKFYSITHGKIIKRAHWRVDTPILEPHAAKHYEDIKLDLDDSVRFNVDAFAADQLGANLLVCRVNSYGYTIYPWLTESVFDFFRTKPFLQQHTHTNIARASCKAEYFSASNAVWSL